MSRGRVYFIQAGDDGPIKIGYTENLPARIKQLQTGQPQRMRVLRSMSGDRALETFLHRKFAAHRMAGEWFHPHRDILRYIIDNTLAKDERSATQTAQSRQTSDTAPPGAAPMPRSELARRAREVREQLAAKSNSATSPRGTASSGENSFGTHRRGVPTREQLDVAHRQFGDTIAAHGVDRIRAPLPRCSAVSGALLSELLGVSATSGWVSREDYQRVAARHPTGACGELVSIGCVCPCDDGTAYVYPLAVVARAALLATGAVP